MPQTRKASSRARAAAEPSSKTKSNKSSKFTKAAVPANGDAIDILEADHREVEDLFARFANATGDAQKRDVAIAICSALKVHARLEEELFYPAAYAALGNKSLLEGAMVEHASAKDLIAQIESGAPGEAYYDARVKVLSEYINHHVKEEESEIFSQCRDSDLDLDALGAILAMRKQELMTGFFVSNPVLALS